MDGKPDDAKPAPDPDWFRVQLQAPDRKTLLVLIGELGLDVDHQHPLNAPDGKGLVTLAFATQAQLDVLAKRGIEFEVEANQSEIGRQRQEDVGKGDRFEGGKRAPQGLGRKVESAPGER